MDALWSPHPRGSGRVTLVPDRITNGSRTERKTIDPPDRGVTRTVGSVLNETEVSQSPLRPSYTSHSSRTSRNGTSDETMTATVAGTWNVVSREAPTAQLFVLTPVDPAERSAVLSSGAECGQFVDIAHGEVRQWNDFTVLRTLRNRSCFPCPLHLARLHHRRNDVGWKMDGPADVGSS